MTVAEAQQFHEDVAGGQDHVADCEWVDVEPLLVVRRCHCGREGVVFASVKLGGHSGSRCLPTVRCATHGQVRTSALSGGLHEHEITARFAQGRWERG